MSRRTSEASRAVREAWEKEKFLVLQGKGTRDWTKEQQQSIIDFGKAYDENGKAFEGHHMMSAEKYPEYQGEASNIQFLSRLEHKDAHNGSFRNSTCGYYDYTNGITLSFDNGIYRPCKEIYLSESVVFTNVDSLNNEKNKAKTKNDNNKKDSPSNSSNKNLSKKTKIKIFSKKRIKLLANKSVKATKNFMYEGMKYICEHPEKVLRAAEIILSFANESIGNKKEKTSLNESNISKGMGEKNNPISTEDLSHKGTHASPKEHLVQGHSQLYHTKNGDVIRNKDPFKRGGSK